MADVLAQVLAEQAEMSRSMEEYASSMVDAGLFGPVLELAVDCNHRSSTVLRAAREYLAQSAEREVLMMQEHEQHRAAGRSLDLDERTDDAARHARMRIARLLLAEAELQDQSNNEQQQQVEVESHATQLRQALMEELHKHHGTTLNEPQTFLFSSASCY
jgi:hypothetical protein